MVYYHYSEKKLKKLNNIKYEQQITFKPFGFWYSKNDIWKKFVKNQGMNNKKIKYKYKLNIDDKKFYNIDTLKKLNNFINKYGVIENDKKNKFISIDWIKVSEKYNGIYFSNYNKIRQYLYLGFNVDKVTEKYLWYLTIDIESGCIFDISYIKKIELVNSINKTS